jgi:phosphotransferase system enzyme I (PtsI)
MLGSAGELAQALVHIEHAKRQLSDARIPFNPRVPVGGMIEVPAAALAAATLGRKLDFFSIGTNDLIQYTLAIDRGDDSVAHLYDGLHPAVLGLVAHTVRVAKRLRKPVSMCGEMAGDPTLTRLLLALGLRSFSTHPAHLLAVKQQVLRTSLPDLSGLAAKVLRAVDSERVRALLARVSG